MGSRNLPVQVIVHCMADGSLQPLRFRFEDADHVLHTVHIDEIVDCRKVEYMGVDALLFLCKGIFACRERLFELKYTVHTHKWVLFRELY